MAAALTAGLALAADEGATGSLGDASRGASERISESLVEDLRGGGHVIYFRHAATIHETIDRDRENLENCETQRNLSEEGRRQAERIGAAFQKLGIPVGPVLASPYCRCLDTARLAFGRVDAEPDLVFALDRGAEETARLAKALASLLSTPPPEGENRIIAGHTVNLREAAAVWPKPEGTAVVFRPDGEGGFTYLAAIHPDAWPLTAGIE